MISKFKKNRKKSRQSLIFSVFLGVLVLVVIGFLVISNLKINQRRTELTSQFEDLKQQLQELKERKAYLEGRISESAQEEYLEEVAREELNLQQSGEQVVAFTKEEEKAGEIEKEKGFLEKFLEKLKF